MNTDGINLFDCDFNFNGKDEKYDAYDTIVYVKYQYLALLQNENDLSADEKRKIEKIVKGLDEALTKLDKLDYIKKEASALYNMIFI